MKRLSCLLLLFTSLLSFSTLYADSALEVHDAWVLEAPPGMKVMAAYLKIQNQSARDQLLTNASSPLFRRVEIHKTEIKNEQARMIRQSNMIIPAGETLKFVPGGHHLMLIGPVKALKKGDMVELTLVFESSKSLTVTAEVRKFDSSKMHHGKKQ